MARPRVFISSTYYDLKHVRSSLETFVETLGFDSILFEKGDIAFDPDKFLDVSCYDEAQSADIFVLIIGGRHGSAANGEPNGKKEFYTRYNSVTEREFDAAHSAGVPIYIVVDKSVHAEYETYKKNRENETIIYAHVESIGVFLLLETIYGKSRNNNVFQFERSTDISFWLRAQWAGLFRDMLQNKNRNRQLGDLNAQVSQLEAANNTLKVYLEEILTKFEPEKSAGIIADQTKKLDVSKLAARMKVSDGSDLYNFMVRSWKVPYNDVVDFVVNPQNYDEAFAKLKAIQPVASEVDLVDKFGNIKEIANDYNNLRKSVDHPPLEFPKKRTLAEGKTIVNKQ